MQRGGMQDRFSVVFIASAVLLSLLLYTYVGLEPLITPILLLMGSVTIHVYVSRRKVEYDPHIDQRETRDIVFYTLLALVGMAVGGIAIAGLYNPALPGTIAALSVALVWVPLAFGVLMAIAETQFFQGELLSLLRFRTAGLSMAIVAGLGVWYHQMRYGSQPDALLYVFVGFALLSFAAYKSGRVLPAMLAHIINNVASGLFSPWFLMLIAGAVFVWLIMSRKRRGPLWHR